VAWLVANAGTESVIRRSGLAHARLTYERFLTDPTRALAEVGRLADVDFREQARMVAMSEPLLRTHAVAGGRVRMSEAVVIDRTSRPASIGALEETLFWLTAGALAWRYGYRPGDR
jgi:hypothetical protein